MRSCRPPRAVPARTRGGNVRRGRGAQPDRRRCSGDGPAGTRAYAADAEQQDQEQKRGYKRVKEQAWRPGAQASKAQLLQLLGASPAPAGQETLAVKKQRTQKATRQHTTIPIWESAMASNLASPLSHHAQHFVRVHPCHAMCVPSRSGCQGCMERLSMWGTPQAQTAAAFGHESSTWCTQGCKRLRCTPGGEGIHRT